MVEVSNLFEGEDFSFASRPDEPIPDTACGVYSIWEGDKFLYVGIAGRNLANKSSKKVRGLKDRLRAHWKGGLGGDQFAVYVFERLISCKLTQNQLDSMCDGSLTLVELNREYIRSKLSFRFIETDTYKEAMRIENLLKAGEVSPYPKPFFNPN